jgi:hypothetical protein
LAQQEEKMTGIPKKWRSNTCSCGSGKPKSAQYDARGIFLTYTCEDCHDRKMAGYRPDVLTDRAIEVYDGDPSRVICSSKPHTS